MIKMQHEVFHETARNQGLKHQRKVFEWSTLGLEETSSAILCKRTNAIPSMY